MRIITDIFAFCAKEAPKWNTISVSGYHIREAGSTALQELAFTLRDGLEYVQWGVDAGLDVDAFVPQMSFFFNAHSDFFEEIAKYRAARKLWAQAMRDRFGAKNERSWKLRFHSQTAGVSLTAQQPYNNVVRTALQALSAVLGGTNSLHTNSLDEALALPTAEAATLAWRADCSRIRMPRARFSGLFEFGQHACGREDDVGWRVVLRRVLVGALHPVRSCVDVALDDAALVEVDRRSASSPRCRRARRPCAGTRPPPCG